MKPVRIIRTRYTHATISWNGGEKDFTVVKKQKNIFERNVVPQA